MNNKHIVLYSPTWPVLAAANGITSYCGFMVPELERAGHKVTLVTRKIVGPVATEHDVVLAKESTNVVKLWLVKLINFFSPGFERYYSGASSILFALNHIEQRCKIDIFEIEESFGWHSYIQKRVKFPLVMRLHGPHFVNRALSDKPLTNADHRRFRREKMGFEQSKYVTAPCNWILSLVADKYECNWSIARVINNPINCQASDLMWEIDKKDDFSILFVGRFDSHKGGDLVLMAFALVVRRFPNAKLIFAGADRGVYENGENIKFDEYASRVLQKKQLENVVYLGQVERNDLAQLRKNAHVTVLASRNENFPYTALEALVSGSPVVAPRVGGIAEVFEHEISGLYFEAGDHVDMSREIIRLLSDDDLAAAISQNARERALNVFALERKAADTICFYQKVISHENVDI